MHLARVEIAAPAAAAFERSVAIAGGNHLARWLAALPPNVLDSLAYRKALQELARREGWSFRFHGIDAARTARRRCIPRGGAGQPASRRRHRPAHLQAERACAGVVRGIALVGKGICFDTGGINLKPHASMYTMHGDMQGSAVAVGTLLALTRLDAPYAIDCWLAITENQIGPDGVPAAGNRARAERHHDPGRAQRRGGTHGARRHADARLA